MRLLPVGLVLAAVAATDYLMHRITRRRHDALPEERQLPDLVQRSAARARKAAPVASSVRATSSSVCAAETNQLWVGWA